MELYAKLKPSIYILKESENVYSVIYTATRRIKRFEVDGLTKYIIEETKKERNLGELMSALDSKHLQEAVRSSISALEEAGILMVYKKEKTNGIYEKQIAFLDELTKSHAEALDLQSKIENSTVAVFGVGGIGTWIVNGLFQIGVGHIKISDPDEVSLSNLNRQLYFSVADVGKPKVEVMHSKLRDAKISCFRKMVRPDENLEDIAVGCDFLVNCADTPSISETSEVIHTYSQRHRIPYSVAGGYNMHLGMVGPIIIPGETACFECFLKHQKDSDHFSQLEKIKDIEQTGNLGPIAGVIANLHVMEIFKYITGLGSINKNRFAEIDFMDFSIEWKEFRRREDCRNCS